MANLVGTSLANNYQKTKETTTMGTRNLAFFQVNMGTDVATNYQNPNSLFSKAIKGLQMRVELYGIGIPNGNNFTVIASAETAPFDAGESNGDGNTNAVLKAAVDAATGANSTVFNGLLRGWNIENDC